MTLGRCWLFLVGRRGSTERKASMGEGRTATTDRRTIIDSPTARIVRAVVLRDLTQRHCGVLPAMRHSLLGGAAHYGAVLVGRSDRDVERATGFGFFFGATLGILALVVDALT
jgi:hypothetical protein